MLSKNHMQKYCLIDDETNRRCRYLAEDDMVLGKNQCLKLTTQKDVIDDELNSLISISIKKNTDPKLENIPMGDNCKGYLPLKHIMQGYDIP